MPTLAEFRDDPLMQSLSPDRAPDSIVLAFLELAEIELEGDRNCLGTHYDRCVILLAAHKTSKWNSAGMANSANVEELPLSEIRNIVSNLSVSDEAGSQSISFKSEANGSQDKNEIEYSSTPYGQIYWPIYSANKCPRSWRTL